MKRILLLLFYIFSTLYAFSCECNVKPAIDSAIKNSDVIFSGKVTDITQVNACITFSGETVLNPDSSQLKEAITETIIIKYTFSIIKHYKGKRSVRSNCYVYAFPFDSLCGLTFHNGTKYIVYGSSYEFKNSQETVSCYFTDTCTRTSEYTLKDVNELEIALKRLKQTN